MSPVVIIFMVVATIFALATLLYVVIDLVLERRKKKESEEETEETEETEDSEETNEAEKTVQD
ncbi:MAG: hypothetical protein IJ489_03790 [Clostridia bacterium]|nr:hypothetical protein [Clostridia bacterium]